LKFEWKKGFIFSIKRDSFTHFKVHWLQNLLKSIFFVVNDISTKNQKFWSQLGEKFNRIHHFVGGATRFCKRAKLTGTRLGKVGEEYIRPQFRLCKKAENKSKVMHDILSHFNIKSPRLYKEKVLTRVKGIKRLFFLNCEKRFLTSGQHSKITLITCYVSKLGLFMGINLVLTSEQWGFENRSDEVRFIQPSLNSRVIFALKNLIKRTFKK